MDLQTLYDNRKDKEIMEMLSIPSRYFFWKFIGEKVKKGELRKRKRTGTFHFEDTKRRISIGRKKFLIENPEKHPWKSQSKKVSVPCETLKIFLMSKGIAFLEEFKVLTYSLDIAFPDKKIAIEVNGNQHYEYKYGPLKPYYQNRHDKIEAEGWKVIEFHYSKCFDDNLRTQLLSELT
jgi:very-short-patch-repair endonuclease